MPRKPKEPESYFPVWGGKVEFPEGVAFKKTMRELYFEPRIEGCRLEFKKSGNPLFAWAALELWLAWGRHFKIDMPVWLRDHFLKISVSLLADGVVNADIPGILCLEGKHHFTEYRKFMRDIKTALRVAELLESGQTITLEDAYEKVADESGKSERVVKDSYRRFNQKKK